MALPQFQADKKTIETAFQMMQNAWGAVLNKVIYRPQNNSILIPDVVLAVGPNTIQHSIGAPLVGWSVVRKSGGASIYDEQDTNDRPQSTLILVSDAVVTVTLEVF